MESSKSKPYSASLKFMHARKLAVALSTSWPSWATRDSSPGARSSPARGHPHGEVIPTCEGIPSARSSPAARSSPCARSSPRARSSPCARASPASKSLCLLTLLTLNSMQSRQLYVIYFSSPSDRPWNVLNGPLTVQNHAFRWGPVHR